MDERDREDIREIIEDWRDAKSAWFVEIDFYWKIKIDSYPLRRFDRFRMPQTSFI